MENIKLQPYIQMKQTIIFAVILGLVIWYMWPKPPVIVDKFIDNKDSVNRIVDSLKSVIKEKNDKIYELRQQYIKDVDLVNSLSDDEQLKLFNKYTQ